MRRKPLLIPIFFVCLAISLSDASFGQSITTEKGCKPVFSRQRWHDDVDTEQRNALKASGGTSTFQLDNEVVAKYVTKALVQRVDEMQCRIETDSTIGDQAKVGNLKGLRLFLRTFVSHYKSKQFNPSNFPTALDVFESAVKRHMASESIVPVVEKQPLEVAKLIVESGAFDGNKSLANARHTITQKYLLLHPEKIFITLKDNPDLPFRDSLIKVAGYKYPRQLYDYAAADNKLGRAIRNIDDPVIKVISQMATSSSGQLYFPFLDNILSGKQTLEQIDSVKDDQVKYYQLLVSTKLDYINRQLGKEKVLEMQGLNRMLEKKGVDVFIKTINDLHNSPDPVRFKILNQLNALELYFLIIAGERDLYTSSYTKGVYPLMMQKFGNRGDSLLTAVGFAHFKKFIRMAAGYNTLSNFLSSFPNKDDANTLMTAFVNTLETAGLEDGVDVADSYASIVETMKDVAADMLKNVKKNYEKNVRSNNKRGIVIYDLLHKLFLSSTDSTINLSQEFNIPPVYSVNYKALAANDTGDVIMQVFFYGDKDGRGNYQNFVPQFPTSQWKRFENKYWISFTSIKGKPIKVFANKPLPEETGEVDKAQSELGLYLEKNELQPTIVIHRGHSYYAPYTIDQLPSSAKIVFLGSCGGYNLIHDVLAHATDAHIIASKQTGRQVINQPFFNMLNEKLRNGNDIDWIPFWREFAAKYGTLEGFGDYVPPHKNLGAIFIKAYKNAMGENEDDQTVAL